METEDHELLAAYVRQGSEAAFTTLIRKYTNFVYSAAARQLGNPMLADEITQTVFLTLTRKAHRIGKNVALAGWLHRATRYACLEALRAESRRLQREDCYRRLAETELGTEEPTNSWKVAAPLLDEAIQSLGAQEQRTIFLRYFDGMSFGAIARTLGETEVASKKRISRSLDRLRKFFAKRGLLIASATLAQTLAARAITPAPTALGARIGSMVGRDAPVQPAMLELVERTLKAMKTTTWSLWKWSVITAFALVAVSATVASRTFAQEAGEPDTSFRATNRFNLVSSILVQPDGKMIVAGVLADSVGDESPGLARGIVRLNADGTHDRSFAPFDEDIQAAALQADGKIIVGGAWRRTNDLKRANLSRLNPDGTLDRTFDPGPGTDWDGNRQAITRYVSWILVQPDQRILVGGTFSRIAGEPSPGLARLHQDGTLDRSFVPTARPGDGFGRPVLQGDGKILAWAGYPSSSGGVVPHLVRLHPDGTLDTTFAPSNKDSRQPNDPSEFAAVQSTGRILAIVQFDPKRPLIRLHSDGTPDSSFAPTIEWRYDPDAGLPSIEKVAIDSRDRIIVAGRFTRVNGVERNGLCRLLPDGSLDPGFGRGSGFAPRDRILVRAISFDSRGRILVGSSPNVQYRGLAHAGILRLWNEPVLRLGPLTRAPDGRWLATVTSLLEVPVRIEVSSDLLRWEPLETFANGFGENTLADPFDGTGSRFYRASVTPP